MIFKIWNHRAQMNQRNFSNRQTRPNKGCSSKNEESKIHDNYMWKMEDKMKSKTKLRKRHIHIWTRNGRKIIVEITRQDYGQRENKQRNDGAQTVRLSPHHEHTPPNAKQKSRYEKRKTNHSTVQNTPCEQWEEQYNVTRINIDRKWHYSHTRHKRGKMKIIKVYWYAKKNLNH